MSARSSDPHAVLFKPTTETLQVDDHTIVLTRVDPLIQDDSAMRTRPVGVVVERSRYRVDVDGIPRGHVAFPLGWHATWEAYSLGQANGAHTQTPKRLYQPLGPDRAFQPLHRRELARLFPHWIASGQAPTLEEITTGAAVYAAQQAAETAAFERMTADHAASLADLNQRLADKAASEAAIRADRVASLEGLRDRFAQTLTNVETDALLWAIEHLRTDRPTPKR